MPKYVPRGDYVLVQLIDVTLSTGGVALPSISADAKSFYVVSCGPDVKDLKEGDQVQMIGTIGEDIARLPREKGLFITKQVNILYTIIPDPE